MKFKMIDVNDDFHIDKNLNELRIYIWDLIQSSFNFLRKMIYLIIIITKDITFLSQIYWLENEKYISLIIHEKRMKLKKLRNLYRIFLKKMKMNISVSKCEKWKDFNMNDDLTNIIDEYNFINSYKKIFNKRKILLKIFMKNVYIKIFFSKNRNGNMILWNKFNYMK